MSAKRRITGKTALAIIAIGANMGLKDAPEPNSFATSGKPVTTTNFQSGGVPVKTVGADVESGLTKPNRKK